MALVATDRRRAALHRLILADIAEERERQEKLRESGKFTHTCATPGISDNTSFRVLFEEIDEAILEVERASRLRAAVGQLARALNDSIGNDESVKTRVARHELRDELIQVASVCVAWLERLDDPGGDELE
jgi:hypothetical protein